MNMCNYTITNEEIEKAEKDIFKNNQHFNDKQKEFLKHLHSCCVQAYAGTGKTTAIVGKLHVLAQKKVWQDGRGICVISHTNVAVDEIKKYVAQHHPAIMEYPNFIGTVQQFVNKFLFIPYLSSKGLRIKFQDELFNYKPDYTRLNLLSKQSKNAIQQALNIFEETKEYFSKIWLKDNLPYFNDNSFPLNSINKKRKTDNQISNTHLLEINNYFKEIIIERRKLGIFLFEEFFIDGYEYLQQNSILKNIISGRFRFVFLDEAQDCSKIQLEILRELFNNSKTIFQQVGDVNQAISETQWLPGEDCLTLERSTRFGNGLAEFINQFQVGGGSGVIGTGSGVKKYLIIYDIKKEGEVLKKYAKILETEKEGKDLFFAVSHKHSQLKEYFSDYSEKVPKNKNEKIFYYFDNDIEYTRFLTKESMRDKGTNFVSRILFRLLYKYFKNKKYSWSELREYLWKEEKIDDFKNLIIDVSRDILKNGKITDFNNLKDKLNTILGEVTVNFSDDLTSEESSVKQNQLLENEFNYNKIKIKVGTIHSVKGQTHSATLLFSNKEEGKQDIQHTIDFTQKRGLKFKKIIYVASSRPRYLFALAMEKSAYGSLLVDESVKEIFKDFELLHI